MVVISNTAQHSPAWGKLRLEYLRSMYRISLGSACAAPAYILNLDYYMKLVITCGLPSPEPELHTLLLTDTNAVKEDCYSPLDWLY